MCAKAKSRVPVFLVVVAVILSLAAIDVSRTIGQPRRTLTFQLWLLTSPYGRLRPGMTDRRVLVLLGKPANIKPNPHYEIWCYTSQQALPFDFVEFSPQGLVTRVFPDHKKGTCAKGEVKIGMTKQQVKSLRGKPASSDREKGVICWAYNLWNDCTYTVSFGRDNKVAEVSIDGKSFITTRH